MSANPLVDVLLAKNSDGTPRYRREDLLAFLPILLKAVLPHGQPLPAGLGPLLEESSALLGVAAGMSPKELKAKLDAYYRTHPGPLLAFRDVLTQLGQEGVDTGAAAARLDELLRTSRA